MEHKKYDIDNDGTVSEDEMNLGMSVEKHRSKLRIVRNQAKMAWVSLLGMVLYPIMIVLCYAVGFLDAAKLLSEITGVYFGSIAVIVVAFMGSEAYAVRRDDERDI